MSGVVFGFLILWGFIALGIMIFIFLAATHGDIDLDNTTIAIAAALLLPIIIPLVILRGAVIGVRRYWRAWQ